MTEKNYKYTKSQRKKIRNDEQKEFEVSMLQKRKQKFRKRQQKKKKLLKSKTRRNDSF